MELAVTFVRTGNSITFSHGRELSCGCIDADSLRLADDTYDPMRIVGWWERAPGASWQLPLAGLCLAPPGSYFTFGLFGVERGTYVLTAPDSITVTIAESALAERIGVSFAVQFLLSDGGDQVTVTNAPMLTPGYPQRDTITLTRTTTATHQDAWGEVKATHR
jgi:hypothetical protein